MAPKTHVIAELERQTLMAMKEDVDSLARDYCAEEDVSYVRFADCFLAKGMQDIFVGRLTFTELVQFTENLLAYSAYYMHGRNIVEGEELEEEALVYVRESQPENAKGFGLTRPNLKRPVQERIFGIYLLYSLYFVQTLKYALPIRISVPQLRNLRSFLSGVLLQEEYYEASFCLYRLLADNAFHVLPFEYDFNPFLHAVLNPIVHQPASISGADEADDDHAEDFSLLKQVHASMIEEGLDKLHADYVREMEKDSKWAVRSCPVQFATRELEKAESNLTHELEQKNGTALRIKKEEPAEEDETVRKRGRPKKVKMEVKMEIFDE